MEANLKGLRAAVTGDATGIGRAIADRLAAGGAQLAFCTPGAGDAARAVQELSEHGSFVAVTTIELTHGPSLAQWVDSAAQDLQGLDLVVCSLGHAPAAAALQLLRAAAPHLRRSTVRAFFVVGDASALAVQEADGLRLHTLPAGASAGDELVRLLAAR